MDFYDGTKLLSMKDLNGNTPELYFITSNNSAGKTTYFNRWLVKRFLEHGEKFYLLYKWKYEIDDVSSKFFNSIKHLFFPEYTMTEVPKGNGAYTELFLRKDCENEKHSCGYAIAINSANLIKKYSHLLNDGCRMIHDEFMPEDGRYVKDELQKFRAIHKALARGIGCPSRYLPVFMIANPITILNPYFIQLGIAERLTNKTKFLRGNGWVCEQGYNDFASRSLQASVFESAFAGDRYSSYSTMGVYLDDTQTFIDKPTGRMSYFCTIINDGIKFGVYQSFETNMLYISTSYDDTAKIQIAINTSDHTEGTYYGSFVGLYLMEIRRRFEAGQVRFKNLICKSVLYNALKYT